MRENTLFDIEEVAIASSKSNEWYTPSRYVEAARAVMGGIDLDPASSDVAQQTVQAKKYYTKETNGLAQQWHGRVWLNPPYGRTEGYGSNIGLFAEKLVAEYQSGKVIEAILCTSGKVEASWFRLLWDYPINFVDHCVRFRRNYTTDGLAGTYTAGHMQGTVFAYLGSNITRFVEIFSEFGPVVLPSGVVRRAQSLPQPTLFDLEVS